VRKTNLGRKGEVDNEIFEMAKDFLNRQYENLYNSHDWDNIKTFSLEITTTTGNVILPNTVDIIRAARLVDVTSPLQPVDEVWLNDHAPRSFTEVGRPRLFMTLPDSPVSVQPAAVTTIEFVSSSTADAGTSFPIRIEGTVNSLDDAEEVDLNGTTPVATTKTFTAISQITKPVTTGRITVTDVTAATKLGDIATQDTTGRYKQIKLIPPPDASVDVVFELFRRFEPLISDNDATILPQLNMVLTDLLTAELFEFDENEQRASYYRDKANAEFTLIISKETELQKQDNRISPTYGMFNDLGDEDDNFRHFDIRPA